MSGKHGPIRRARYFDIHATVMGRFVDDGFVTHNELVVELVDPSSTLARGGFFMTGRIGCEGGVVIDVDKIIAVVSGDPPNEMVQTVSYGYHVHAHGIGNVLRYCSPEDGGYEHHATHHRHAYDVFGADPTRSKLTCIPQIDDVPTLGEVIEEARGWYYGNLAAIEARQK